MNEVKERKIYRKRWIFSWDLHKLQSFTYIDQGKKKKIQLLKIIIEFVSITSECIEI